VILFVQFKFKVHTFAARIITYLHGNPTREAQQKKITSDY